MILVKIIPVTKATNISNYKPRAKKLQLKLPKLIFLTSINK